MPRSAADVEGLQENDWWTWPGSNRRPPARKAGALPTELHAHHNSHYFHLPAVFGFRRLKPLIGVVAARLPLHASRHFEKQRAHLDSAHNCRTRASAVSMSLTQ